MTLTFIPGAPDDSVRYASPTNARSLLVGLVGGAVALLHADTGRVIWRKQLGGEITGLAHGGDIVYLARSTGRRLDVVLARSASPYQPTPERWDENGDPIYERDPSGPYKYHIRTAHYETRFDLARIEARRASDGALLWRFTSTRLPLRALMLLTGESLVVWSNTFMLGSYGAWGLDARTGAVRWRRSYPSANRGCDISPVMESHTEEPSEWVSFIRAIAAHDGRLYADFWAYSEPPNMRRPPTSLTSLQRRIEALDAATGATLWRQEIDLQTQYLALSTGGALIATTTRATPTHLLTIRSSTDGALVGTSAYPEKLALRAITDDGVVYLVEQDGGLARLHTLHIAGAASEDSQRATTPAAPDVIPAYNRFNQKADWRARQAEVYALDVANGGTRWRWVSPKNLVALLRLWGLRAPRAFAASVARQARKAGPRFWTWLPGEIEIGQWRHPTELISVRLDMAGDMVYVSGRLGVFALRARDGALRWAGLPNREVDTRVPIAVQTS